MINNNILKPEKKYIYHLYKKGTIKSTEKYFGFLEINDVNKTQYFIPPIFMKNVMHGDKVIAIIHNYKKKHEMAEPKKIIKAFLSSFIGQIKIRNKNIFILPEHQKINILILTELNYEQKQYFKNNDWVIAKINNHPLKDNNIFFAKIISHITHVNNILSPWLLTLARYNLEFIIPQMPKNFLIEQNNIYKQRKNLTELDFITIDNNNTENIDDAIYINNSSNNYWVMTVAIADPTELITHGSKLDLLAKQRTFSNYLPGLSIPMLPKKIISYFCSLLPNKQRPALACQIKIYHNGKISSNHKFFICYIKSKAKLAYNKVSDWLENIGNWQPPNNSIAKQIKLLQAVYQARQTWRKKYEIIFINKLEYRFIFDKTKNIKNIIIEPRRIANYMIEEAMITANICAAKILRDKFGYGIYNTHSGFNTKFIKKIMSILHDNNINIEAKELLSLKGFCALHQQLTSTKTTYLYRYINQFKKCSEISLIPKPHFGLGLTVYATWTSPLRKYSDIINHRLIKNLLGIGKPIRPNKQIISLITKRKHQKNMAVKNINKWLYAMFLQKIGNKTYFKAEIIDINDKHIKVCLVDNGAIAIIPNTYIFKQQNKNNFNYKNNIFCCTNKDIKYKYGDIIYVIIIKIQTENKLIIVKPIKLNK